MNWTTVQDAIKTWFSNGTGLTVVWFNQPRPRMDKPMGLLQILSVTSYGTDNIEFNVNVSGDPGVDYVPTVRGQRSLVVTCQVYSRDQSANLDAINYLERARAYSRLPNTRETLLAAGVTLWNIGDTVVMDALFDKRIESRASFDVTFGIAENIEFSNSADSNSWIERVEMSGDFEPEDGPDFTDEIFGVPI